MRLKLKLMLILRTYTYVECLCRLQSVFIADKMLPKVCKASAEDQASSVCVWATEMHASATNDKASADSLGAVRAPDAPGPIQRRDWSKPSPPGLHACAVQSQVVQPQPLPSQDGRGVMRGG